MEVFGQTRSRLARDHALITPDTHVVSPLVGWQNASSVVHISPEMGARFLQYTAVLNENSISALPAAGAQRMFYVREGAVRLQHGDQNDVLQVGGFAFLPAGYSHSITTDAGGAANLIVFEKNYLTLQGQDGGAEPVIGNAAEIDGEPFMGDPDAVLQTLLPITPLYDMAVNIFTYQPGATLPQVEIHTMEHGLQMIGGMGVYRLSENYYPVADGDVIWMASYCPQWFVAMGKQPASYIYYKDIHRDRSS